MKRDHSACRGCFWYDQCDEGRPCDYYYPVTENEAEIVEAVAEARRRREFAAEYEEYLQDWA